MKTKETYIHRIEIEQKLNLYFDRYGQQLILDGSSESGKTTLLNYFLKKNHIKSITTTCKAEPPIYITSLF